MKNAIELIMNIDISKKSTIKIKSNMNYKKLAINIKKLANDDMDLAKANNIILKCRSKSFLDKHDVIFLKNHISKLNNKFMNGELI